MVSVLRATGGSAVLSAERAIAVKPGGSGDVTNTEPILWTYAKGTAYVVSPLL